MLRLEFWLRGDSVPLWNLVPDISALQTKYASVLTIDDKKQGTTWVKLGHKFIQDINLDRLSRIDEVVRSEYAEILAPFFDDVEQLILAVK